MFPILYRHEQAQGTIVTNVILAPRIAEKALPGQFVIVMASETGERIPLTIADKDEAAGTITIVYSVVGKSTRRFSKLRTGDSFMEVTGPLGKPTPLKRYGDVVCVGGGTGIAVLHPVVRGLKFKGNRITTLLGVRTESQLVFEDRMRSLSETLTLYTDDGSSGSKGIVTDQLEEILRSRRPDLVVAIGPVPMMKAVSQMAKPAGIPTLVSLNPVMIDGTGMCGGCRVTVGGDVRFACVEGPEFDGHQVDYDELMMRLNSDEKLNSGACDAETCRLDNCTDPVEI